MQGYAVPTQSYVVLLPGLYYRICDIYFTWRYCPDLIFLLPGSIGLLRNH